MHWTRRLRACRGTAAAAAQAALVDGDARPFILQLPPNIASQPARCARGRSRARLRHTDTPGLHITHTELRREGKGGATIQPSRFVRLHTTHQKEQQSQQRQAQPTQTHTAASGPQRAWHRHHPRGRRRRLLPLYYALLDQAASSTEQRFWHAAPFFAFWFAVWFAVRHVITTHKNRGFSLYNKQKQLSTSPEGFLGVQSWRARRAFKSFSCSSSFFRERGALLSFLP